MQRLGRFPRGMRNIFGAVLIVIGALQLEDATDILLEDGSQLLGEG